ncbi:MAG: tetratricopeptide repeat protein, partial [Burkholderiales bacterium]
MIVLGGKAAAAQQAPTLSEPLARLFAEGVRAQKGGDLGLAEKNFIEVLRQGGKVSFVYNNLGIVHQMRGDHARAVELFREAARLQPDYVAPHILAGASLLAMGRVAEATRELEFAVKLQPEEPLARLQLAKAFARAANFPARIEQLRALRNLVPQEPEYAYQLGDAYLQFAGWCAREMTRIDPRSARVYQMLGENYRVQAGRTELAIRAFKRAAQADP